MRFRLPRIGRRSPLRDEGAFHELARARGYIRLTPHKNFAEMARARGWIRLGPHQSFAEMARARGWIRLAPHDNFGDLARARGWIKLKPYESFGKLARAKGWVPGISMEKMLAAQHFAVDEVIDVGVHAGTRWLYDHFADKPFVLVEPLPGGEDLLTCRPDRYTFVNAGVGAEQGTLTLRRFNNEKLSSFLDLHNLRDDPHERRHLNEAVDVPVMTLDDVIEQYCTSDRIGIKIDTEGFELEVVRGLDKHRSRVVFVIAEASIVRRHMDSYQFSDLVAELRDKDFYVLNVMNTLKRSAQFFDTIFVQRHDPRLTAPVHRIADLETRDRAARKQALARG